MYQPLTQTELSSSGRLCGSTITFGEASYINGLDALLKIPFALTSMTSAEKCRNLDAAAVFSVYHRGAFTRAATLDIKITCKINWIIHTSKRQLFAFIYENRRMHRVYCEEKFRL